MTTFTKDDGSPKKGVYHSDLRKASPLTIRFKKHVLPTKYKGKLPFAPFFVDHDENEYTLQVENDECADAINRTPLDVWVTVTATGMNSEEARLDITLPEGYEPPPESENVHRGGGRASSRTRSVRPASEPATVLEAYQEALRHARDIRVWYLDEYGEEIDTVTKEIAATLLIQSERSNWRMPMGPEPEDGPSELADVEMVEELEALLAERQVPENIEERLRALIDNGITVEKCESAIDYCAEFPERNGAQDDLPF